MRFVQRLLNIITRRMLVTRLPASEWVDRSVQKEPAQPVQAKQRSFFLRFAQALGEVFRKADPKGRPMMRTRISGRLSDQRTDIESIEIIRRDLPIQDLRITAVEQMQTVTLISGPPGVGKSALIRRLKSKDVEASRMVGFERSPSGQFMKALDLEMGAKVRKDRLILEYSICRQWRRSLTTYEDDSVLKIMRTVREPKVYILVCPKDVLLTRLRARGRPKPEPRVKTERLAELYSRPGGHRQVYEAWISFCKAKGWPITYVDARCSFEKFSEDDALKLLHSDS